MKLEKIEIKNFKSIKNMTIEIKEINDRRCFILIGKNEAGKSNILKAIRAVFGDYQISLKDRRKELHNEEPPKEFYIKSYFSLEKEKIDYINKNICNSYVKIKNEIKHIEIKKLIENKQEYDDNNKYDDDKKITYLRNFFDINLKELKGESKEEIELEINTLKNDIKDLNKKILENKKNVSVNTKFGNILQHIDKKLSDLELEKEREKKEKRKNYLITNLENYEYQNKNAVKNLYYKFDKFVKEKLELIYENFSYFEYKKEYLLPNEINIDDFINNEDKYLGFKNLVKLCGYENIKQTFKEKIQQEKGVNNLLDRISNKINEEFEKYWKNEKVSLILNPNGNNIDISIEDNIKFSMEERSDGLKRFFSLFSVLYNKNNSEKIILLDEPDAFLYPLAQKYLQKNY